MNTLFAHLTGSVLVGVLLLISGGCGVYAPEMSAKAPAEDAIPAVTHSTSSLEATPVSVEIFAALLDRA